METVQIALLGLIFLIVFGVVWGVITQLSTDSLQRRIAGLNPGFETARRHWSATLTQWVMKFAKLSSSQNDQGLQTRFMNAGWRDESLMALYFGAKTVLVFAVPALVLPLVMIRFAGAREHFYLMTLSAAAAGFYLPNLLLKRQITQRQRAIAESLPNVIELITISVEAGLGLDAAIKRVTGKMGQQCPALKDEFDLVLLEILSGVTRDNALRNLVQRTGVEELRTLTTLLIQSERFGISVGESLRAYTASLLVRRQQRAEELAGKIPVKLLFPMVFFIFPSLIVVLIGPGALQILRVLVPLASSMV